MPVHRVQRTARTRKEPVHKTARRELHPIQRAFLCGALLAGASQQSLSRDHGISQATISRNLSRLRARAAELGIADLTLADARVIKEAPRLFEDQNRRGRKELLTPEQRAAVVAVITSDKQYMRWKAARFASMRKLEDGTIERSMHPDLVALGLPQMSTSTLEGCMYEAGYVRTKDGWKQVRVGRREKTEDATNVHDAMGDETSQDPMDQTDLEQTELPDDALNDDLEPFSDPCLHPDLHRQHHHQAHPDMQAGMNAASQHDVKMQLEVPRHHDPSLHQPHSHLDPELHESHATSLHGTPHDDSLQPHHQHGEPVQHHHSPSITLQNNDHPVPESLPGQAHRVHTTMDPLHADSPHANPISHPDSVHQQEQQLRRQLQLFAAPSSTMQF